MDKDLYDIREAFCTAKSLGHILELLYGVARAMTAEGEFLELASISDSYRRMQDYVASDADDAGRGELYDDLKYRAYVVLAHLTATTIAKSNPTFAGAQALSQRNPVDYTEIESRLDWFYSEVALSRLPGAVMRSRLVQERTGGRTTDSPIDGLYEYRQRLFASVYTTLALSASEAEALERYLLSPKVDYPDARLLLSALLLSQNTLFDVRKFRLLVKVYTSSLDPDIRQIALVVLAMTDQKEIRKDSYPYYELRPAVQELLCSEHIREDVVGLQIQVLHCMRTEQTSRTIQDEILPTIHKSATGLRPDADKTRLDERIPPCADALLDDLLRPGRTDPAGEKMEESLNRMREMQQSGVDVFFSGFSHAKRFVFFHTLMNWFVPFSIDHPQIQSLRLAPLSAEQVEKMLMSQPFCDSDKYSFYITLSTVINRIPDEMIDILKKGAIPQEADMNADTACRRRLYLQDLYRFFNLYTAKSDFLNPFRDEESALFVCGDVFQMVLCGIGKVLPIARFLLKHGEYKMLERLLASYQDPLDPAYAKLKALMYSGLQQWADALTCFKEALYFEQENYALVHKTAVTAMQSQEYELAVTLFDRLILEGKEELLSPEDEYCYAFCLMRGLNYSKALQILQKLDYLYEGNAKYGLLLATVYVKNKDRQNALNRLFSVDDDSLKTDNETGQSQLILKSLLLWCVGERTLATDLMTSIVRETDVSRETLSEEITFVQTRFNLPISMQDQFILIDLATDNAQLP